MSAAASGLTWRWHRHRVAVVAPGVVELDGQGDRVDLELCSCYAWRKAGARRWHGSHFRAAQPALAIGGRS